MEMEFSVGIRDKKSAVELYDKNTNVRGLQDLGQGLSLRDLNLRPLGQCLDPKLQKGNGWRYPGISGPTYCLTSCSPVVRALVYQPSGPGSIPGMSRSETAITRGKTLRTLLPPTTFLCTKCLCAYLLAGFLARYCH